MFLCFSMLLMQFSLGSLQFADVVLLPVIWLPGIILFLVQKWVELVGNKGKKGKIDENG